MKESKQKICKVPGCNKEVFDSKLLLCGEHQRSFTGAIKKIGLGIVGVGGVVLKIISDKDINKKS